MSIYIVEWETIVTGAVHAEADSSEEAAMIAKQLVGAGISVAANLHAPPGISFKVEVRPIKQGVDLTVPGKNGLQVRNIRD
jgi:hypothetical protein